MGGRGGSVPAMLRWLTLSAAVVFSAATTAPVPSGAARSQQSPDLAYDGRFTFVRLRWEVRHRGFFAAAADRRGLEPRLPARGAAPVAHPQGAHRARRSHRRQPDPRRSTIPSCSSIRSRSCGSPASGI